MSSFEEKKMKWNSEKRGYTMSDKDALGKAGMSLESHHHHYHIFSRDWTIQVKQETGRMTDGEAYFFSQ